MRSIPGEVFKEAFGDAWMVAPGKQTEWQRKAANVIAEWARKEALREAAKVALSTPLTLDDIGHEAEEIAYAIRALAEGGAQ